MFQYIVVSTLHTGDNNDDDDDNNTVILLGLNILIYLLTPWSRVLEKLTASHLVKKFPTFYGTRRVITAFTSACHLSLS